ncbi:MAG: cryptochrome/photolyase family protein, partial [Ilumatobacteraceae bacterium]
RDLGVELVRSNQFLCHHDEFAEWATDRGQLKMEDFYRWQRRRLGYLMDGDEPVSGRWNHDSENRRPPPGDDHPGWPTPPRRRLDDLDREVLTDLEALIDGSADGGRADAGWWGAEPDGTWATSRRRRCSPAVRRRCGACRRRSAASTTGPMPTTSNG